MRIHVGTWLRGEHARLGSARSGTRLSRLPAVAKVCLGEVIPTRPDTDDRCCEEEKGNGKNRRKGKEKRGVREKRNARSESQAEGSPAERPVSVDRRANLLLNHV